MDNFPLKRGRGRPKGSKNAPKPGALKGTAIPRNPFKPDIGETKIGHMLCAGFSFKNLAPDGSPVIIICHNAYPSDSEDVPGKYRCPDLDSCLVRWSRAKEQYAFEVKKSVK
jgi:hypothetical protein